MTDTPEALTEAGFDSFHPLVREWFLSRRGKPTRVQAETWGKVSRGAHVLALAPTGSGKTLAAFLHAISRLVSGELPSSGLSVLYVSPLKALNEDVRRNLEGPLEEIDALFAERGVPLLRPRVETRSGDTPQSQRRRFLSKPPQVLCTTPESLALLLDSPRARPVLAGVRLLILDEIHALAGSKRGSLLACSVGRLALLAGEFQRVALSATVEPPWVAASFVGGRVGERDEKGHLVWKEREVEIVSPPESKRIEWRIEWPKGGAKALREGERVGWKSGQAVVDPEESRYDAVIPAICDRINAVRSLLVFTDSRRRAERIAFLINERMGEGSAWAHHGSLAREARLVVEERFKRGELRCVVATASLELGIDIGSVDEVVLAGAPAEVAVALQRAGRSGHGVGAVSKATLYPFHGMDLLRAIAVVQGAAAREIEALKPPLAPLDILAQVLLELACEGERSADTLYDIVQGFPPFTRLDRLLFNATLEMLAGRYSTGRGGAEGEGGGARLRELEPRIFLDKATGMVRARDGAKTLLWTSGGSIPDRGHYSMRIAGSETRIGELDEEFVFERSVGDAFTLGTQSWRIVAIGNESVEVAPLGRGADFIPFWKGETQFRSAVVSRRILELLDRASGKAAAVIANPSSAALSDAWTAETLADCPGLSEEAAQVAVAFVARQAQTSGGGLPGTSRLSLEVYLDPARKADAVCVVLHSLRGGAVNQPLALALQAAIEEELGVAPEAIADDDFILLLVPAASGMAPAWEECAGLVRLCLLGLARPGRLETLVKQRLEGSGLFGAQFRENSGRALLIARGSPGKRNPLWVTRLRAKRLFEAVRDYPDFPVTAETWRSCLVDLFDMDALEELVQNLAAGRVELVIFVSRSPSPFAREAIWKETGEYMYQGDAMAGRASSRVSDDVIKAALASSRLRPRLAEKLIGDFESRTLRLLPGWGAQDSFELAEWIKELVLLPESELPAAIAAGGLGLDNALALDPDAGGRIKRLHLDGASETILVHAERLEALKADPASHVSEWLRRRGPVAPARIAALFGLSPTDVEDLLDDLEETGEIIVDEFRETGNGIEVIDAENLEILLRMARKAARPELCPRPRKDLFRLITSLQRLALPASLPEVLDSLSGFPLPVFLWESEILPVRVASFSPSMLDAELSQERLWVGMGRESVAFCRPEELELIGSGDAASALLPSDGSRRDFWELRQATGFTSKALALSLWSEAWDGLATAEGFSVLREGLKNRFGRDLPEFEADTSGWGQTSREPGRGQSSGGPAAGRERRLPRALREGWKRGAPVHGEWFSLELGAGGEGEAGSDTLDALDEEELNVARVRMVGARWGLLSKATLEREAPLLRFGPLFRAMRRMELSGELVAGRFFEGIDGPQFLTREAFGLFSRLGDAGEDNAEPLWINALDPAVSALGPAEAGNLETPARLPGTRLCVLRGEILAIMQKSGRELVLASGLVEGGPVGNVLDAVLRGLVALRPRLGRRIALETINGLEAVDSPLVPRLIELGFEKERRTLVLW